MNSTQTMMPGLLGLIDSSNQYCHALVVGNDFYGRKRLNQARRLSLSQAKTKAQTLSLGLRAPLPGLRTAAA
jgi:hypothetical protein